MKKFPWDLLFVIAVFLGILKLVFFYNGTTFEYLAIMLLVHISYKLEKGSERREK